MKQKSSDLDNVRKRLVLTGGHAGSTAFVTIEEVRRQNKNWDVVWIGFGSSLEGQKVASLSSLYFPKYGIKTYSIVSGRIQRKFTIFTLIALLKIPLGFIHAAYLLLYIRPHLILSFGGFAAFPVVVVGWLYGIPVILHEQTSVAGRANKFSAFFAKRVAVSRETSYPYFPRAKTILTGNPIPKDLVTVVSSAVLPKIPIIFVTGGQSGAVVINTALHKALPHLLEKFKVIHLTGIKDAEKFREIREELPSQLKKNYSVEGIVDPKMFNRLFNSSSLVISRAGANTVSKIIAAAKPSILIPLPFSYQAEQEKNALYAKEFGVARIIKQAHLTHESLITEINYIVDNWKKVISSVKTKQNPDLTAASSLVDLVSKEMK